MFLFSGSLKPHFLIFIFPFLKTTFSKTAIPLPIFKFYNTLMPIKQEKFIKTLLKSTAIALTLSALALALSACQTTPSSQVSVNANKLNHISYANVAYDNINERQKMDIYLPKNHRVMPLSCCTFTVADLSQATKWKSWAVRTKMWKK